MNRAILVSNVHIIRGPCCHALSLIVIREFGKDTSKKGLGCPECKYVLSDEAEVMELKAPKATYRRISVGDFMTELAELEAAKDGGDPKTTPPYVEGSEPTQ